MASTRTNEETCSGSRHRAPLYRTKASTVSATAPRSARHRRCQPFRSGSTQIEATLIVFGFRQIERGRAVSEALAPTSLRQVVRESLDELSARISCGARWALIPGAAVSVLCVFLIETVAW